MQDAMHPASETYQSTSRVAQWLVDQELPWLEGADQQSGSWTLRMPCNATHLHVIKNLIVMRLNDFEDFMQHVCKFGLQQSTIAIRRPRNILMILNLKSQYLALLPFLCYSSFACPHQRSHSWRHRFSWSFSAFAPLLRQFAPLQKCWEHQRLTEMGHDDQSQLLAQRGWDCRSVRAVVKAILWWCLATPRFFLTAVALLLYLHVVKKNRSFYRWYMY